MGSHDAVVPRNTKKLIIVNRPLLNNAEVPISILANDRTLVEALGLARSTVVRTFPADNVSILVSITAIKANDEMVRGTTHLDLLLKSFGNTSSLYVDIV